jgi:hypothetical protein
MPGGFYLATACGEITFCDPERPNLDLSINGPKYYIPSTATCNISGAPIAGQTVRIGGISYSVAITATPTDELIADIPLLGDGQYDCTGDCDEVIGPYAVMSPCDCNSAEADIYVCLEILVDAIAEGEILDCLTIIWTDGCYSFSGSIVAAEDVPDGATIVEEDDDPSVFADCCECFH